jgi:High-affinity nickel-transport protein
MTTDLFPVLGIGLVLGFRHAFEPDHIAAVTTLAGRTSGLRDALRLALGWALGHTTTIALAALVTIAAGFRLPDRLQPAAELLVALVLIVLGALVIVRWVLGRWHLHSHSHGGTTHLHLHSHALGAAHHHAHPRAGTGWALGIGLLHGLAGSGAVLALLVAAAPTRSAQWTWLAAFGLGTVLGMSLVSSTLVAAVRVASSRGTGWIAALRLTSAAASLTVGGWLAARILVRL